MSLMRGIFTLPYAVLFGASSVNEGAGNHILLEYLVEIVRARKAYRLGYLVDRRIRGKKKHKGVVDASGVDIINGGLAYAVLKHLGKIIR